MIQVTTIPVGNLGTNAYLVTDVATGLTAVVDPGSPDPQLLDSIAALGEKLTMIWLTHGHFDHIGGVAAVKKQTGAEVYLHKAEAEFPKDSNLNLDYALMGKLTPFSVEHLLEDGDTIPLGESTFTVLHTPGHTGGSICFLTEGHLFSGDTLFHGSMGRTDFPTGSPAKMMASLGRLCKLEGDYQVYPGHGPASTLDWERQYNPYLRQEIGREGKTDDFVY